MTELHFDTLIIGSGIAGLTCALKLAGHGRVGILTKRRAEDSNTAWAQGGLSCVRSEDDSFDLHVEDTMIAGAGLCHEDAARLIVEAGPGGVLDLEAWGVEFDRDPATGEYELGLEGGHSRKRILHAKDETGKEISRKLVDSLKSGGGVELLEGYYAIDFVTTAKLGFATKSRMVGVYALNQETGSVVAFRARRVVLATGGCGRVYQFTTNPRTATGDGVAMAWRAGASISNMEFVQFHPTCLYSDKLKHFLISEALRGEGATLRDKDGVAFMVSYDKRGDLAPRDIVARAIDSEIKRTGHPCVYLDITDKSEGFVRERFPLIYQTLMGIGIDPERQLIPVVPSAHYQCGGVRTDLQGRTDIEGLYAVGEVACTGLHGANRLASNSLLEGLIMGRRAAEDIIRREALGEGRGRDLEIPEWRTGSAQDVDELVVIYHNWDEIRRLMWDYVSIVRTSKRLTRAANRLRNLHHEVREFYWSYKITAEVLELRNLVETASLIVDGAVSRRESRGAHFSLNYPEPDAKHFGRDTVVRRY